MSKKIKAFNFDKVVSKLLDEYGEDVSEALFSSMKSTINEATEELKSVKKWRYSYSSSPYSNAWMNQIENVGRFKKKAIAFNVDHYQLSHLLENGHAVKRGGRVVGQAPSYPHIEPINKKAQDEFIKDVLERIQNDI